MMGEIMTEDEKILEGQLRECYGRVVYTHKTHEKCADILLKKDNRIKVLNIILSAIIAGGLITIVFDFAYFQPYKKIGSFIAAIIATIQLVLNSYTKDYDLGAIAQKHRQAGADLWLIREKYLSLLTEIRFSSANLTNIISERDKLMAELHSVYTGAPSTDYKSYQAAQKALKELEDMTFSDEEIDKFLPKELKRKQQ